jgi:hypothetical protein
MEFKAEETRNMGIVPSTKELTSGTLCHAVNCEFFRALGYCVA